MAEKRYLTTEEFLAPDTDLREFESKVWGKPDSPAFLQYRPATVADKKQAGVAAKKGKDSDEDSFARGLALVAICTVNPKIPLLDAERLAQKNAREMERYINAICGDLDPNG